MQSSVNKNAIKLTLQTNTSFLWKLPLALQSVGLQQKASSSQDGRV